VRVASEQQVPELVGGNSAQQQSHVGVKVAVCPLDSFKIDVRVLPGSVFAQKRLAEHALGAGQSALHDVHHKLVFVQELGALVRFCLHIAIHPCNFDSCQTKNSGCFLFSLQQH